MTQPPYDSGGVPPYATGGGPQTPPGFAPAQTPWAGQPLAAGRPPSQKKFALVMAFFATLLVASVVGFVVTAKDDVARVADKVRGSDPFGNDPSGPGGATVGPETRSPREPKDPGPVPKPITYQGTGSKVPKIRRPEKGDALVYVKARPAGFLLTVYGVAADGTRTGFVITSTEAYEGVRLLDVTSRLQTTQLEIEAAGPWTVQVRSARSAKAFDSSVTGNGDSVLSYTGRRGTASIRGGEPMKPFLVMARKDDFPQLVVSAVGRFDGQKVWPPGPVLVEIQASGAWSIRVR